MQTNNFEPLKSNEGAFEIETIDYRKIFVSIWRRRFWFILTIGLSLILGWFYNRYQTRTYRVSAKYLVEEGVSKGAMNNPMAGLMPGYDFMAGLSHFDNQIVVVQSYKMLEEAAIRMDQVASIYVNGEIQSNRVFRKAPFKVEFNLDRAQVVDVPFTLKYLGGEKWNLTSLAEDHKYSRYHFHRRQALGQALPGAVDTVFSHRLEVDNNAYHFTLNIDSKGLNDLTVGRSYTIVLHPYDWWVNYYKSMLSVSPVSKETTILKFSMVTPCVDEGIAFIDTLMETVIKKDLERKNSSSNRNIAFIDAQLKELSYNLSNTEKRLEDFQTKTKMVKLTMQAEKIYEQLQTLETDKEKLKMQMRYFEYLKTYLQKRKTDGLLAPSSAGVDDPLMLSMVTGINKLLDELTVLQRVSVPNKQRIVTLQAQLNHASATLQENVVQMIGNVSLQIRSLDKRMKTIVSEVESLPEAERTYLNIQREFKVNDNIYTYLLQRRAEISLTKVSHNPNGRVIDEARLDSRTPVSPKPMINYLVFLLLGVMIPFVALLIESFFFDRIVTSYDLKSLLGVYPLAEIGHSKEGNKPVISGSGSMVSEQFRSFRVRLTHQFKETKAPLFLFSSVLAAEGKTFVSYNTALSFSEFGKKTVWIGTDLRKPYIHSDYDKESDFGLAEYLSGKTSDIEEIIQRRDSSLDVISAGSYGHYSPVDLLSGIRMNSLIKELKLRYDYIILDSSPLGLSFDTDNLLELSDQLFIVTRSRKTPKSGIKMILEKIKKFISEDKLSFIVNDVTYHKHGYGYGYGYGYGEKKKKSLCRRIIDRFK